MGAGQPLFDRADATGGEAVFTVHDQDVYGLGGQLVLQYHGQLVQPIAVSRGGVEEVAAEILEQQRPQAYELRDVVLHRPPYTGVVSCA